MKVRSAKGEGRRAKAFARGAVPRGSLFGLHFSNFSPAFTLIEVMMAGGILFMCLFAILALLSNGLRNARALQGTRSDPRSSIASEVYFELSHTNTLSEGSGSGEFGDYRYSWEVREIGTNGLCEVDIAVAASSRGAAGAAGMQMVMFLPQLQQRLGGGAAR